MGNKTDRKTLKSYFQTGKSPTEEHFSKLIDSFHNIIEDGQIYPVIVYPRDRSSNIAEIYTENPSSETNKPTCWSLSIDSAKSLALSNEQGEKVLSITQEKLVSFFNKETAKEPNADLTISIPSDGQWHDLPIETDEYSSYRIIVCYEYTKKTNGKVIEVTASQRKGCRPKLSSSMNFGGCWLGKILFRWNKREDRLFLQVRCRMPKVELSRLDCTINKEWSFSKT